MAAEDCFQLRFTAQCLYLVNVLILLLNKKQRLPCDSEHHVQTQTYSDHRDGIHQTHNDKESSTQQRNQIRLTRCAFR